jgi:hypothetical protein
MLLNRIHIISTLLLAMLVFAGLNPAATPRATDLNADHSSHWVEERRWTGLYQTVEQERWIPHGRQESIANHRGAHRQRLRQCGVYRNSVRQICGEYLAR